MKTETRNHRRWTLLVAVPLVSLAVVLPASADQVVYFVNGKAIMVKSVEKGEKFTILEMDGGGKMGVPTDQIAKIEEYQISAPAPAATAVLQAAPPPALVPTIPSTAAPAPAGGATPGPRVSLSPANLGATPPNMIMAPTAAAQGGGGRIPTVAPLRPGLNAPYVGGPGSPRTGVVDNLGARRGGTRSPLFAGGRRGMERQRPDANRAPAAGRLLRPSLDQPEEPTQEAQEKEPLPEEQSPPADEAPTDDPNEGEPAVPEEAPQENPPPS